MTLTLLLIHLKRNKLILMKYLGFVFLLLTVSCGFTQKEVVEEQHSDGTPKKVARYEYGIKTKEFEFYFNGKKKKETSFKDSLEHGEWKTWFEYGNLHAKGNCKMGKDDGLMTEYSTGGIKVREVLFENGKELIHTKFNQNGNKFFEINSKDNKLYAWYDNGQLKGEMPRIGNGSNNEYYEDGSKKIEGFKKAGAKDSIWSYWDQSGNLIKEVTYKNGKGIDSVVHVPELANNVTSIWVE